MRIPTFTIAAACALFLSGSTAQSAGLTTVNQGAAQSEGFANSAIYNSGYGMNAGQENAAPSGTLRDANGNLLIVNGIMSGAGSVTQQDGVHQSSTGSGASATAVGNSLNVQVQGNWNTVIVNSTQTNNGSQSATATLNGGLDF